MTSNGQPNSAKLTVVSAAKQRAAQFVRDKADESTASGETRLLLHARLRLATWCLLIVLVAFFMRDLFVQVASTRGEIRVALIVLLAGALLVLYRMKDLSMFQLRTLELVVFGLLAFQIAYDNYWSILEEAHAGIAAIAPAGAGTETAAIAEAGTDAAASVDERFIGPANVLSELQSTTMSFFALIIFYGMFIPNTLRRAAALIGGYGVVFCLLLPVMQFHDPKAWSFIRGAADAEELSEMLMMVLFGVGISITASSIIHTLRREVIEAREMGQYRLTDQIGVGGMGEVWRAEHTLLARPAAVKLIRAEILDPDNPQRAENMIRRFEREAQNTARLRSVHTVELYDFGLTDEGDLYFVMELLDGVDLETLVEKQGPVPPARVRFLIRQACDSLAEAHEHGLVHRDIKPANIFTCRLGGDYDFVKVLDFGLAKAREAEVGQEDIKLTTEGMVIGTPAYMAPEVATGRGAESRSDIYALGCVIFWMLTGQLVFEGAHPMSMVVRHVKETPDPPSKHSALKIPLALDRLVLSCLEKDPANRPASVDELKRRLDALDLEDEWGESDARQWWQANHRDGAR